MRLAIIVVGLGNIGKTWLRDYAHRLPAQVYLRGAANSKRLWLWPLPDDWQQQKAPTGVAVDIISDIAAEIEATRCLGDHVVVLDLTASKEISRAYPAWIRAGAHMISANKYTGSSHPHYYNEVRQSLTKHHKYWLYNTTVGAGLPIQKAIRERRDCYDEITAMEGNFSGSLSWVFQQYRPGDRLSEWLKKAADLGLTEPDARLDLSGMDVARKLLILARDAGWSLQLQDVSLHNLVPESLRDCSPAEFWQQHELFDAAFEQWRQHHYPQATQFCYIGRVGVNSASPEAISARTELVAVSPDSPYAHLPPGNASFIIRSPQYQQNPLVIQGPGAGPEVTAAGVHSDVLELIKLIA